MGRAKLSNQEKIALLVVMTKELKIIFEELETDLIDYNKVSNSILENMEYILKKGLKIDPEDTSVYDLFDK